MTVREINFDGIVGPSHNYAGLSFGNVASMSHFGQISEPRAAALQGLEKMRANLALGLTQGIFVPHPRPHRAWLAELGADIEDADFSACRQCDVGVCDVGCERGHCLTRAGFGRWQMSSHGREPQNHGASQP